jgi:glycosyltransferase involved in cell wall biosynthesis
MTNKIDNISCVIIVQNAQDTIEKVLKSLSIFNDIILYSNNSTDNTNNIAKKFSNVNLIIGDFLGFGPTKNKAASFAKNNWILSLDADEVLSSDFINSLDNLKLNDNIIYSILRTNYYKKSQIKYCWGNDIIVRLYNKNTTSFTNKKVHEKIIDDAHQVIQIDGLIHHYPYTNITDFIVKLDRYSTIFAEDNIGKKKSSPLKAIVNATYSFIKTYIFKRGFLDGHAGLIIAFSHMATNFYKYMKLYELNKEQKK